MKVPNDIVHSMIEEIDLEKGQTMDARTFTESHLRSLYRATSELYLVKGLQMCRSQEIEAYGKVA